MAATTILCEDITVLSHIVRTHQIQVPIQIYKYPFFNITTLDSICAGTYNNPDYTVCLFLLVSFPSPFRGRKERNACILSFLPPT